LTTTQKPIIHSMYPSFIV